MHKIKLFFIVIILINTKEIEYCDDCEYSCCNVYDFCAISSRSCYCEARMCRHDCCVNNKCGDADECAAVSKIAIVVSVISATICCLCCFSFFYYLVKSRKRSYMRNRVVNVAALDQAVVNLNSNSNSVRNPQIGQIPPINSVYIGTPLDFQAENINTYNGILKGEQIGSKKNND